MRFRCRVIPVLISLAFSAGLPLCQEKVAEAPQVSERPVYVALRAEVPPVVDGDLSDPAWKGASPALTLTQQDPKPEQAATERTEVRVLYTESAVYFGIKCYDSEPRKIAVSTMERDGEIWNNDHVRVLLDTFLDRRNAYVFEINAAGAKRDGLAKGDYSDYSWDGIWDGKARRLPDGWSAEISVPTKTVSFKPGLTTWGFNLERIIARKVEIDRWASPRRNANFSTPALAGDLAGLEGLKQGRGYSVRPYASYKMNRDYAADPRATENKFNGGVDVYKSLTSNLNSVLTYRTDFAETEADSRQINLTRFSLFYPEKRGFFLEGSTIFDFGSGVGESFIPFFSRRIGLVDGQQVPIVGGAKLWGRVGGTNVGFLDVQTESAFGIPSRNLLAARVKQNIFDESSFGFIFTNGNPGGKEGNSLFGGDFNYNTTTLWGDKNFSAGAWLAYSRNEAFTGQKYGYGVCVDYPNDLVSTSLVYREFGDAMDPALGFLPRSGVRNASYSFEYKPRPQKWGIRQMFFEIDGEGYWNLDKRVESWNVNVTPLCVQWDSGDLVMLECSAQYEFLYEPFEISDGIVIPPGPYRFDRFMAGAETADYRLWQLSFFMDTGTFYSGRLTQYEGAFTFKPNAVFKTSIGYQMADGSLPAGRFIERLLQWRAAVCFSPDIQLMALTQYDNTSRNLGTNVRFRWTLKPGTDMFVVYNRGWDQLWSPDDRFAPNFEQFAVKFQYTWRP